MMLHIWGGGSTCLEAVVKFSNTLVRVFGPKYLRELTVKDTEKVLAI